MTARIIQALEAHPQFRKTRCCLCFVSIKAGDQVMQFSAWDNGLVPDCETPDCPSVLHAMCVVRHLLAEAAPMLAGARP